MTPAGAAAAAAVRRGTRAGAAAVSSSPSPPAMSDFLSPPLFTCMQKKQGSLMMEYSCRKVQNCQAAPLMIPLQRGNAASFPPSSLRCRTSVDSRTATDAAAAAATCVYPRTMATTTTIKCFRAKSIFCGVTEKRAPQHHKQEMSQEEREIYVRGKRIKKTV